MKIFTKIDVDEREFRKAMAQLGVSFFLRPSTACRMENRNELLVHCDEELCWFSDEKMFGPKLLKSVRDHHLVNFVAEEKESGFC